MIICDDIPTKSLCNVAIVFPVYPHNMLLPLLTATQKDAEEFDLTPRNGENNNGTVLVSQYQNLVSQ